MAERDANPETDALGLDAASLVGMTTDQIRSRLSSKDLALILPDEPLPEGWPVNVFTLDRDTDSLTWQFQLSTGEWRTSWDYLWSGYEHGPFIPAFIYSRAPLVLPQFRVLPIVRLRIDKMRRCVNASARHAMQD